MGGGLIQSSAINKQQPYKSTSSKKSPKKQAKGIIAAKTPIKKTPKGKAPKVDEYQNLIDSLTKAQGNMTFVNQNTPEGSSTWVTNPDGTRTQNITLNPADQQRLDWRNAELSKLQPGVDEALSAPLSFDDLGHVPTADDFAGDRAHVEDALLHRASMQLDPQYAQEKAALEQHLASSGNPRGSEQFTTEMDNFERRKSESYAQARDQAVAQGQTEQANLFNRALTARQQAINERITKRSQPLQEYGSLLGFDGDLKTPTFPDVPKFDLITPGVNVFGIKKGQEQAAAERALSAKLAADANATQLAAARIAAGGGGGGGGGAMSLDDWKARQSFTTDEEIRAYNATHPPQETQKKPSGLVQFGTNLTGSTVGSFFGGAASTYGSNIAKSGPAVSPRTASQPRGKGLLGLGNARLSGFR